jgi:ATP synthase protein I
MTDQQQPTDGNRRDEDSQLADRLRRLDDALGKVPRREANPSTERPASRSDAQGLARALRMSSEFVAGVLMGAGIGWLFDRLLGTAPWGLIVFLLLGFAAGVLNVMRAAGLSGPASPPGGT